MSVCLSVCVRACVRVLLRCALNYWCISDYGQYNATAIWWLCSGPMVRSCFKTICLGIYSKIGA